MTILVTGAALQKSLVTLADVKTAIAPGDSDDAFLTDLIIRASRKIGTLTRRKFEREAVTETLSGSGTTELMTKFFPIVNISEIRFDSSVVDADSYQINGESGLLYRAERWAGSTPASFDITVNPLPWQGNLDWALDYTSGFLLPTDDFVSALIAADTTAKTFTLSSGTWPLLVAGDIFTLAGWVTATANNRIFTVVTRTDSVVTVSEAVTTSAEGDSITVTVQTLPEDLEELCIEMVKGSFYARSRDGALKSEKIGDWAASWGTTSMSADAKAIINEYKVMF